MASEMRSQVEPSTRTEIDAFGAIEASSAQSRESALLIACMKTLGASRQVLGCSDTTVRVAGSVMTSDHGTHPTSSLQNFVINQPRDRMPDAIIRAYGILKGAAAAVNVRYHALGMTSPVMPPLRLK